MRKDYDFYRCRLERRLTGEGDPCLLAVTEVVQAICDAGFQKHGTSMWSHPSSPHCYFKYAKTPRDGMFKLRAVKISDMTTLDFLIDTRMYPYFLMIENNPDWQDLMDEVINTLQQMINDEAEKYNYQGEIIMYHAHKTQYLDEFASAMAFMKDHDQRNQDENNNLTYNNNMETNTEDLKLKVIQELTKGNVRIGQIIMEVKGNNTYYEQSRTDTVEENISPSIPTKEEMIMAVKDTVSQGMWWSNRSWSVVYRVYQIKGYMGGFSQFIAEAKSWQIDTGFELNYDAVQKPITSGKLIGDVEEWEANGAPKQAVVLAYAIIDELEKQKN